MPHRAPWYVWMPMLGASVAWGLHESMQAHQDRVALERLKSHTKDREKAMDRSADVAWMVCQSATETAIQLRRERTELLDEIERTRSRVEIDRADARDRISQLRRQLESCAKPQE